MEVKVKSWFESKTVWLNLITGVVMMAQAAEVVAVIPESGVKYAMALVAVLNIVLRVWFTNEPVKPTP